MKKIIIDCDPGVDDALAIMLALNSPELEVLGITTVAGNARHQTCAQNALRILELCNQVYIPVYEGAEQPLKRQLNFSDTYCGIDGLGESKLPVPTIAPQKQNAIDFIIEAVKKHENITIVSIAPMTNIAKAIQQAPDIAWEKVNILTMAGYYRVVGPEVVTRPRCEWNVLVDPEAYEVVVRSGVQFKALGLDITTQLENHMMETIIEKACESNKLSFLQDAIAFNIKKELKLYSLLVDAVPMAYAIDESLAKFTTGTMAINYQNPMDQDSISFEEDQNVTHLHVATQFNFEKYIQLLIERVFSI